MEDGSSTNSPLVNDGDPTNENDTTTTNVVLLGKRNASMDIALNGVVGLSARDVDLDVSNSPKRKKRTSGNHGEHIGAYQGPNNTQKHAYLLCQDSFFAKSNKLI